MPEEEQIIELLARLCSAFYNSCKDQDISIVSALGIINIRQELDKYNIDFVKLLEEGKLIKCKK